jgi:hypothetical protein
MAMQAPRHTSVWLALWTTRSSERTRRHHARFPKVPVKQVHEKLQYPAAGGGPELALRRGSDLLAATQRLCVGAARSRCW